MQEKKETFKDPNQLDMFEGIILNVEQQKKVDYFLSRKKTSVELQINLNKKEENILLEAGFIKGKHFKNDFKTIEVTQEVGVGYLSDNSFFKTELTYLENTGGIKLLTKKHFQGEIEIKESYIGFTGDGKVNSWTICGSCRYVLPKTLLKKLEEYNSWEEKSRNNWMLLNETKRQTVNKYSKLYPTAKITTVGNTMKIQFPSGSYITYSLYSKYGSERVNKIFDAVQNNLTIEQMLENFSKQKPTN